MRESMGSIVKTKGIKQFIQRFGEMGAQSDSSINLYLCGPKESGKSTLVHAISNDFDKPELLGSVFACSSGDILVALQVASGDSFLNRIGDCHILLVDDVDYVFTHSQGDLLLKLLLEKRMGSGLHTVLTSKKKVDELGAEESLDLLRQFERIEFAPLTDEEKIEYLHIVESRYANEESPKILEDAMLELVEHTRSRFQEAELAIRYLTTTPELWGTEDIDRARLLVLLDWES